MVQPKKSLNICLAPCQSDFIWMESDRWQPSKMTLSATSLSSCTLFCASVSFNSYSGGRLTRCGTSKKDLENCFRQTSWKNLHPAAMSLVDCRVSGGSVHTLKEPMLGFMRLRLCWWPLGFCRPLDGYLETDFTISNEAIKMQVQRNDFLKDCVWSSITDLLQLGS